jgi:hypothetical protein
MTDSADMPAGRSAPVGSERFRLAQLARAAALRIPAVTGTDTGPIGTFLTAGGGERVNGVLCVATKAGGYEVSLRLICSPVPLTALGEQVRAAVTRASQLADIPLDKVNVHIADVTETEKA